MVCTAQGVANRDIKLENVLIDSSPRPLIKICDFGYSKVGQSLRIKLAWHNTADYVSSGSCLPAASS